MSDLYHGRIIVYYGFRAFSLSLNTARRRAFRFKTCSRLYAQYARRSCYEFMKDQLMKLKVLLWLFYLIDLRVVLKIKLLAN